MPASLHDSIRPKASVAALRPRSESANSHAFLPTTMGRIARSIGFESGARLLSSLKRTSAGQLLKVQAKAWPSAEPGSKLGRWPRTKNAAIVCPQRRYAPINSLQPSFSVESVAAHYPFAFASSASRKRRHNAHVIARRPKGWFSGGYMSKAILDFSWTARAPLPVLGPTKVSRRCAFRSRAGRMPGLACRMRPWLACAKRVIQSR